MIRQFFFASPESDFFSCSLNKCLELLQSHYNRNNVLGVIFFIDSKSDTDYFKIKNEIQEALILQDFRMPFNVQAQSSKTTVSIEIWIDDAAVKMEYLHENGTCYTRVTSNIGKSIWGIGITSNTEQRPLADQIEYSFERAHQILVKEGMTLSDIVRQWNYVPDILNIHTMDGKKLQHYQIFNDIRQKYYSTNNFKEGYPAATGIGTKNGNYDLDFFAVKCSPKVQKLALSNPKQQDAYEYDQSYLVGDAVMDQVKKTPLFERAKILKTDEGSTIFISGTASIIGQETIGVGDIKCQTEITIKNIQELISKINNYQSTQFTYLRAYIKEESHFQMVRSICEASYPDVSISYLQADVCRENLLVEIEGAVLIRS